MNSFNPNNFVLQSQQALVRDQDVRQQLQSSSQHSNVILYEEIKEEEKNQGYEEIKEEEKNQGSHQSEDKFWESLQQRRRQERVSKFVQKAVESVR